MTISGSSQRLQTASMTSATRTVTEILTMVSASSEPMNVAEFNQPVRWSANHCSIDVSIRCSALWRSGWVINSPTATPMAHSTT